MLIVCLTLLDASGKVRCFNKFKLEWGFAQLLPHSAFHDANNGYLVHDKCIVGAEIFVVGLSGKGESVSPLKLIDGIYTWKIDQFSILAQKSHYSEVFSQGDFRWYVFHH